MRSLLRLYRCSHRAAFCFWISFCLHPKTATLDSYSVIWPIYLELDWIYRIGQCRLESVIQTAMYDRWDFLSVVVEALWKMIVFENRSWSRFGLVFLSDPFFVGPTWKLYFLGFSFFWYNLRRFRFLSPLISFFPWLAFITREYIVIINMHSHVSSSSTFNQSHVRKIFAQDVTKGTVRRFPFLRNW